MGIGRWALAGGFLTSRATGEDWASWVALGVKKPLPVQEMLVWSLDGQDSLEEEVATYSSILAWKIP